MVFLWGQGRLALFGWNEGKCKKRNLLWVPCIIKGSTCPNQISHMPVTQCSVQINLHATRIISFISLKDTVYHWLYIAEQIPRPISTLQWTSRQTTDSSPWNGGRELASMLLTLAPVGLPNEAGWGTEWSCGQICRVTALHAWLGLTPAPRKILRGYNAAWSLWPKNGHRPPQRDCKEQIKWWT